ncbi:MAG: MBL fold metallo-hydrolase [Patescibacteria group bacterium]|nr:MBL fold metallo-hydrolase [Patescibacteria group bacterium]
MNISFHGACEEVTGSCTLVKTDKYKFLVDCGSFQGEQFSSNKNTEKFAFNPEEIDFVLLTHSHLDHCGRLPKLVNNGFKGKIYATLATKEITKLILEDASRIMSENMKLNRDLVMDQKEIEALMTQFENVNYDSELQINDDIKITYKDAGHILGSASIMININDSGVNKKIIFSGDLGNPPTPIIRDTEFFDGADAVIIESTYGGLIHEDRVIGEKAIRDAIIETVKTNGVLIIPVFAVERSQEILYMLNEMVDKNLIPRVNMFFDSPMGIRAVNIYKRYTNLYDEKAKNLVLSGDDIYLFKNMEYTLDKQASKKINSTHAPKIILAGSGMCNGGRVIYHLKFNLENPKTHVMLLSYQAKGTLGRKLFDGEKKVIIEDEPIEVRAKISTYGCFSAHADNDKLINWVMKLQNPAPSNIFINHGEPDKSEELLNNLKSKTSSNIQIAKHDIDYEI